MTNSKLISVMGASEAEALAGAGIYTTDQLLARGASSAGRMRLADETHLADAQIKEWVHLSDLLRLDGVSASLAVLLAAAGVMTVPKLAYQTSDALHAKLQAVNQEKSYLKKLPTVAELETLIHSAKRAPKMVRH